MKKWQLLFAFCLIVLSIALYGLHYVLFHDLHHIFIYLMGDIAFVPMEVLIVTLIIHRLLSRHEKKTLLGKMNMVIGAFFSEVGNDLLKSFIAFDAQYDKRQASLHVNSHWKNIDFTRAKRAIEQADYQMCANIDELCVLQRFLLDKRPFFLSLLENSNVLEHDSFTQLLWAVFHVSDELLHRENIRDLSKSDYLHLQGDIKRAYRLLLREWLLYLKHLKKSYPYLFSLAIRLNPFNTNVSVSITE